MMVSGIGRGRVIDRMPEEGDSTLSFAREKFPLSHHECETT